MVKIPNPLVTVVIPVFRAAPLQLRAALQSLAQQSWRDFEVIVIEDPSSSSADSPLEQLADERFRYIRNDTRTSLPHQHNQGLKLSAGAFLCRFDSDDICEPEKLEVQVRFLQEHPDIDVVGSNLIVIDGSDRVIGERRYPAQHDEIMSTFPLSNPIANPTVMFRRQVFERFGGWDESSTDPAQDYEWFSRIAKGGARFANLQRPLVRYRVHPGSIKRRQLRGTLRTTISVKQTYWREQLGLRGRVILGIERFLLLLPATVVYRLFLLLRYRSGSPSMG